MNKPLELFRREGVTFLNLPETRFTTARLTVNMYLPLRAETAGKYALVPFMLRRGCAAYPDFSAFHRALDRLYGAQADASVSRVGETQMLTLSMTCLEDRFVQGENPVSEPCAQLLLSLLFDPPLQNGLFAEDAVEQEKRIMLQAIAAQINDKRRYARLQCERLLCEGEPYAVPVYGTPEQVAALTPKDVTEAWRDCLAHATVKILYQGSSDASAIAEVFAQKLSHRSPVAIPNIVHLPAKEQLAQREEAMDVDQCRLVMGYRTEIAGEHPLSGAMRLAVAILGGTPQSLLFQNVREKLSLCYYCSAVYDRLKGVMLIDSGVDREKLDLAREEISCQMQRLRGGDFSDDDLEQARLAVTDALRESGDSAEALAAWYAAQGCGEWKTPEETVNDVAAVTREQVLRAAETLQSDCIYTLIPKER